MQQQGMQQPGQGNMQPQQQHMIVNNFGQPIQQQGVARQAIIVPKQQQQNPTIIKQIGQPIPGTTVQLINNNQQGNKVINLSGQQQQIGQNQQINQQQLQHQQLKSQLQPTIQHPQQIRPSGAQFQQK